MMKKTFLLSVFAVLLAFVGCEKDPAGDVLSVSVEAGEATADAVKFTVKPNNAEKCAFLCLTADQLIPAAADILANGTQIDASGKTNQHVKGLQPETTYSIIAAVQAGEETAVSQVVKMTTLKVENPDDPENPEDPENPNEPDEPVLNVTLGLALVNTGSDNVTVQIKPTDAEVCRYMCVKAADQQPSDEDVLTKGLEADAAKAADYTVKGLESSTEYRFIAVAKGGEKVVRQELLVKTKGDWKTGEEWTTTYGALEFFMMETAGYNSEIIDLWLQDKTTGHIITLSMVSSSSEYLGLGDYQMGEETVAGTILKSRCQVQFTDAQGVGHFIDMLDARAFVEVVDGQYKITFQYLSSEDETLTGGVYTGLIKGLGLPA